MATNQGDHKRIGRREVTVMEGTSTRRTTESLVTQGEDEVGGKDKRSWRPKGETCDAQTAEGETKQKVDAEARQMAEVEAYQRASEKVK